MMPRLGARQEEATAPPPARRAAGENRGLTSHDTRDYQPPALRRGA